MDNSDKEFLETYSSESFEKPSVAVDLLIFTIHEGQMKVLLVKRTKSPFKDMLALPGTFVGIRESLDEAVKRVLKVKAGISDELYFEQLFTWGDVDRDPRMRIIAVSYLALVPDKMLVKLLGGSFDEVMYPVSDVVSAAGKLAFDHRKIIEYGRERIKNKTEYTNIAFELLDGPFTLPQLQDIYEILLDRPLYKANFRKKISNLVEETGEQVLEGAHRPSKLYRRKNDL